jgi:hypothetical protein
VGAICSFDDSLVDETNCFVVSLDVESLENLVWTSSQDVASSILTGVTYGAVGRGSGERVISIRHLPAEGQFAVPESAPSCFEDVEFSFMLDFRRGPEFITGVGQVVWGVFCPGGGIDAFEGVLA